MVTLQLKRGDVTLGTLHDVEWELFWCAARFEPTEAFAPYKDTFDREYQAVVAKDWKTVRRAQAQIKKWGLRLVDETGAQGDLVRFGLHIHGEDAQIRPLFGTGR